MSSAIQYQDPDDGDDNLRHVHTLDVVTDEYVDESDDLVGQMMIA